MAKAKFLKSFNQRAQLTLFFIYTAFFLILLRLFYWQIIKGPSLQTQAQSQSQRVEEMKGERGKILTTDGYLLVGNKEAFRVYLNKEELEISYQELIEKLTPLLLEENLDYQETEEDEDKETIKANLIANLENRLNYDARWILLINKISQENKEKLDSFEIDAFSYENFHTRLYPEASMAAHLTGFVGKNEKGEDLGYFGVEGALNKELEGKISKSIFNTDALGLYLLGQEINGKQQDGRDVVLTIRRDLQYTVQNLLKKGVERYEADKGEIILMDPKTGKILSLATWPHYNQDNFTKYETADYKNPSIADVYEPGSTLKVLTISAGLDAGVITPETQCTKCAGPRVIAKYTIKTWNEEYHPDITMTEALAKSDNIAMIFVAEKLGADNFKNYLQKFGIGEAINIDLQEDTDTPFPSTWRPVELATRSFGQGISTNSFQLIRAISAVANEGEMMRPMIIEKVIDPDSQAETLTEPIVERQVIKKETAQQVTEMMINAAHHGEAQWTASKHYTIAGKTGTSQIATKGGYAEDKTIASFVGFAPASDPKFIMLVKLVNPQSSPWAAETAAPLWYEIADKIFLLMNISPDK